MQPSRTSKLRSCSSIAGPKKFREKFSRIADPSHLIENVGKEPLNELVLNYRETYIVDRLVTELDENIHASDGTFYVYVQCRSALHWTHANRQLAGFATVHQDDEGVLVLFPDAGRKRGRNAAALHRPPADPRGAARASAEVREHV